jgi:hypothetical protein
MEAAVERNNMLCAYERVVKNQGAPGVDGLTVAEFKPWLQARPLTRTQHLLRLGLDADRARQSALNGRGPWWNGGAAHMHAGFPQSWFDRMGLLSLLATQRRFSLVS